MEKTAYSSEERLEATKAMTSAMLEGSKMLVLINGGAVAGIVSGYASLREHIDSAGLKFAAFMFVVALVFVGFIPLLYWMGQSIREGLIKTRSRDKRHDRFLMWAAFCLYGSIGCFATGALVAIFSMK